MPEHVGRVADEMNRGHFLAEDGDRAALLARVEIPDLHGIVGPAGDDDLGVALPTDTQDVMGVPLEGPHELARRHVEDLDELVGPARGSCLPSGEKATPKTVSLWASGISRTKRPSLLSPRSSIRPSREAPRRRSPAACRRD